MRQKLYLCNRPLAHLFQQLERQNVTDRWAMVMVAWWTFITPKQAVQSGFAICGFLCLVTARWCTPILLRERLWIWCAWGNTQDELDESSISTTRPFNGSERDGEMEKVVNVALDLVARGKPHQSLTGSSSLAARGTDLTMFQRLLSFGILGHESTAQGHNFVFKHDNAPPHRTAIVTQCHASMRIRFQLSCGHCYHPTFLPSNIPGIFLVDAREIPYARTSCISRRSTRSRTTDWSPSGISSTKMNSKHCATQCHEDWRLAL